MRRQRSLLVLLFAALPSFAYAQIEPGTGSCQKCWPNANGCDTNLAIGYTSCSHTPGGGCNQGGDCPGEVPEVVTMTGTALNRLIVAFSETRLLVAGNDLNEKGYENKGCTGIVFARIMSHDQIVSANAQLQRLSFGRPLSQTEPMAQAKNVMARKIPNVIHR